MNFSDLYCYINKLKIKQISLEKSETDFLRIINTNYDGTIEQDYDKLKNLREQDCNDLRKDVQDNIQSLKQIKTAIVERNLENIDLDKLKTGMLSFENFSNFLKQRINTELENLMNDEMALTIETTNIEMKITDLNKKPEHECNKISRYSSKCTSNHHLQEEVKEFITFVNETGGHNGGWLHEDHILFLKIFNKIRNKKKLLQSLLTLFPDMTKTKLLDHIDWYKTYLQLKNKQKIAIEKWRENKTKKQINCDEENKEDTTQKIKKIDNNNKCMKEEIEKWKAEKQQRIESEQTKNQNSAKTKQSEKQRLKKQEIKIEIRKWKTAKEAKLRAEKLAKEIISLREKERRMLLANKLIRDFQSQDNVYISKRLNRLKINVKPPESSKRSKKAPRNPERIFRATRQWLARTSYEQTEEQTVNKHLPLKNIPKLAVPSWRQAVPQF